MDQPLVAPLQPVIVDGDAGRRRYSFGAQRHRRENAHSHGSSSSSISPTTRFPYPLPYYRTKLHPKPKFAPTSPLLDRVAADPAATIAVADDEPLAASTSSSSSSSSSTPQMMMRHSVPDVVLHGPRIPMHGARARFVSLPVAVMSSSSSSSSKIDTERDRLERACGRAPTALAHLLRRIRDDPPPPSSRHQSPQPQPPQPAVRGNVNGGHPTGPAAPVVVVPPLAPKWSHWPLVLRIKRALRRDGKDIRDYIEAGMIDDIFVRDVEERARRVRERARSARVRGGLGLLSEEESGEESESESESEENNHIFGVPLNESVLRAPATAILGGYRHDLPLVVFLCVEELYRTGIYKSGLFRDLPNRQRHHELSTLFDTPPAFGEGMSLRAESTADICALLLTYLKELPEPILTPYLFNAFWNWCVRPSVKREDERTRKEQDEEEDLRTRFFQTGQRPPRPSSRALFERARLRTDQDEASEMGQVAVARDLLRLLPTHCFSLIVYLCAFFTQVPLCPENGIAFEDIGRIFGPPVFGGPVPAARRMMVWFLKRWNRVSDGLLDAEPTEDDGSGLSRRDVRVLERADSFELLAPEEEQDEDELDFRATLMEHHHQHQHQYHPEEQRRASRDRCVAQEMRAVVPSSGGAPGWPGEVKSKARERSFDPDPTRESNHAQSIDEEALLPAHVFAPMSRRPSTTNNNTGEPGVAASPFLIGDEREREDARKWRRSTTDAQLLLALGKLHEARARIDELELAVEDAVVTQSGRRALNLKEVDVEASSRFEQEIMLSALERDEANQLVKNVCEVLKGVAQQHQHQQQQQQQTVVCAEAC